MGETPVITPVHAFFERPGAESYRKCLDSWAVFLV